MSARADPTQLRLLGVTTEYTIFHIRPQARPIHRATDGRLHNVKLCCGHSIKCGGAAAASITWPSAPTFVMRRGHIASRGVSLRRERTPRARFAVERVSGKYLRHHLRLNGETGRIVPLSASVGRLPIEPIELPAHH